MIPFNLCFNIWLVESLIFNNRIFNLRALLNYEDSIDKGLILWYNYYIGGTIMFSKEGNELSSRTEYEYLSGSDNKWKSLRTAL